MYVDPLSHVTHLNIAHCDRILVFQGFHCLLTDDRFHHALEGPFYSGSDQRFLFVCVLISKLDKPL
ncbi:hypothetical protein D3261_19255 [Halococcus sp. IIIV-5B]|nr:hypothetical protein D3261_19255 [Halococcus sp. IIIV-5B]